VSSKRIIGKRIIGLAMRSIKEDIAIRRGKSSHELLLFVGSFTPVPRQIYRVGVPLECHWNEILNSDAPLYGGSGQSNMGGLSAAPVHGRPYSLTLPPLGVVVLKPEPPDAWSN
jgi:1,4-alpha-glucan branching enzyme